MTKAARVKKKKKRKKKVAARSVLFDEMII